MSTASSPSGGMQEIDWLAAETRAILQLAERQAQQRGASAIYPEHLLLGLLEQHPNSISTLVQQSKLDLSTLRTHAEASFPTIAPANAPDGPLRLAAESVECIENAIALVTYHLEKNKAAAIVLPEHLLLSLFYHPRMQRLFAGFSTSLFQLKSRLMERETPGFVHHMEQIFLFPAQARDKRQKVVHLAHLHKTHDKHILRSIEYPYLTFRHIQGQNHAKQTLYKSIAFLHQPSHHQETSHGLLLLSRHSNDDIFFIRAIAGEAGVPLSVIYCSTLVEMFLTDELSGLQTRAEKAYQLMREVFYPIKMFSHCLIYFQDLEALTAPDPDRQQSHAGWEVLRHQFLIEFDKLKRQQGTVVIASTPHVRYLHADFLRPGRLDRRVELQEPFQLQYEQPKQVQPPRRHNVCPNCKRPIQPHWKHCVYCRTKLTGRCRNCGTPYPTVSGARFCPECGEDL